MEYVKENIVTIILIMIIIIVAIVTIIVCYGFVNKKENADMSLVENQETIENVDDSDNSNINNEKKEIPKAVVDNSYTDDENSENENSNIDDDSIDMSKYYLNSYCGVVAEIYNNMLDELGKQKCIVKTSNGSSCRKSTIDLKQRCFLDEYDDYYKITAYTGDSLRYYQYNYNSSPEEIVSSSIGLKTIKSDADFVQFAVDFDIIDGFYYKWNYSYNENVIINGYSCYEIIAEMKSAYTKGEIIWEGKHVMYIDMDSYKLIGHETSYFF